MNLLLSPWILLLELQQSYCYFLGNGLRRFHRSVSSRFQTSNNTFCPDNAARVAKSGYRIFPESCPSIGCLMWDKLRFLLLLQPVCTQRRCAECAYVHLQVTCSGVCTASGMMVNWGMQNYPFPRYMLYVQSVSPLSNRCSSTRRGLRMFSYNNVFCVLSSGPEAKFQQLVKYIVYFNILIC
jgi:hypothetical protein